MNRIRRTAVFLVCLTAAFQFLSLARAITPLNVWDARVGPLICPDEPQPLPDMPLTENSTLKHFLILLITEAYGSDPQSCNWNAEADLNRDSIVNILDAIVLAGTY